MYQRLLAEIRAAQTRYGEQVQPPCTDERLARLRRRARDELSEELPDEYSVFLRAQDGLNHNGLYIYASETAQIVGAPGSTIEGIVEANQRWRIDQHLTHYLVFGEGNMDLYVRHSLTGDYHVIDRVPENVIESYRSYELLMAAALRAHL